MMPEVAAVAGEPAPPPEFEATLSAEGAVRLAGTVTDATSRDAILSYAAALFGHDRVIDATEIDPALPAGWPGRVLAGVEALAALEQGKVVVTPEKVAVDGSGLEAEVSDKVAALLAAKVDGAAEVHVTYDAAAAAAAADAARPQPELCADQISAILAAGSIQFAARLGRHRAGEQGGDRRHRRRAARLPGGRLRDRRAHQFAGLGRGQPAPERRAGAGGAGGAPRRGPADGAADRPRLRRRRTASPTTPARRAGRRTGGSSSPCCPRTARMRRRRARPRWRRPRTRPRSRPTRARPARPRSTRSSPSGRSSSPPARRPSRRGERPGHRGDRRGAARLPRDRLRDRRLHRLAGLGEREPAAEPGARRGGAGGAARPRGWRCRGRWRAATARRTRSPTTPPPTGGRRTGGSPSRRSRARRRPRRRRGRRSAARGRRRRSPRTPPCGRERDACVEAASAIVARTSIQFAPGLGRPRARERPPVLDEIAAALRACPDVAMEIGGHTDSEGSETGNERLSQRRAEAVLAALRDAGPRAAAGDGARLRREPAGRRQRHRRGAGGRTGGSPSARRSPRATARMKVRATRPRDGEGSGDGSQ